MHNQTWHEVRQQICIAHATSSYSPQAERSVSTMMPLPRRKANQKKSHLSSPPINTSTFIFCESTAPSHANQPVLTHRVPSAALSGQMYMLRGSQSPTVLSGWCGAWPDADGPGHPEGHPQGLVGAKLQLLAQKNRQPDRCLSAQGQAVAARCCVTQAVKKTFFPHPFLQDFTIPSAKLTVLTPIKRHLTFGFTQAFYARYCNQI